ncbi:PREDICTED: zinc finger protein 2-like [Cyphomyrmex costatus]|uniref:zinc finger protein 2-like n=1 Tax=Cyphomyrmex costatus TaxID=456900 RepID=UPI00085236D5|nr:PREDICTED: zinc finger protein 2-like [Cyphomyrmex costatus]
MALRVVVVVNNVQQINLQKSKGSTMAVNSGKAVKIPKLVVKNIQNLRYAKKPVIYKCTRCTKSYQLETSLRRHQRLECGVHPKYKCLICGKQFTHKFVLTHHLASCLLAQMLMSQDPQDNNEWSQRRASDGLSYKLSRFNRKKSIGDPKYECNRCGKTYRATTSLSRHKRLECGVVPCEVCPICERRFKHRFVLNAHIVGCERRMNQKIQKKEFD